MRALGCGAEPIHAETLRAFIDAFAPAGLRSRERSCRRYGMAEATLAITFDDVTEPFRTDRIDRDASTSSATGKCRSRARRRRRARARLLRPPFPGHEVAIVDDDGAPLGEREVGEIWLRGPSVTAGYYGEPEATARRCSATAGCAPATSATSPTASSTSAAARRT